MDKAESNFGFRLMALTYRVRDSLRSRKHILDETGIKPGDFVLDYGCGSGSYTIPLAELVGGKGKVWALDIHPLAIKMVRKSSSKRLLANIEGICSGCETGLPDKSMDAIIFFDVFHNLSEPETVLAELHRVLKPAGILFFSDHHLKEDETIQRIKQTGLFALKGRGKYTYSFTRVVK